MALAVTSPAFRDGGAIPKRFTCQGRDTSPELAWTGVPPGAKSLALIVDDPDAPDPAAPRRTWVHWVVYDISVAAAGLPEGGSLPPGARQGTNDWHRTGYGGPCPPVGRHRYFFKLYALDAALGDIGAPNKGELERAIEGHVLSRAQVVGTYEKE